MASRKFGKALGGAVMRPPLVERVLCGVHDVGGRGEIRLAYSDG